MDGKKDRKQGGGLSAAAVLLLLTLFGLLAAGTLVSGVAVSRGIEQRGGETYLKRTALSYLVNQVRGADEAGAVDVCGFHGVEAVRLREELNGTAYVTYLYCWDGALRELFMEEGLGLSPESGVAVAEMAELRIQRRGDLLSFSMTDGEGRTGAASVALRTGEAAS